MLKNVTAKTMLSSTVTKNGPSTNKLQDMNTKTQNATGKLNWEDIKAKQNSKIDEEMHKFIHSEDWGVTNFQHTIQPNIIKDDLMDRLAGTVKEIPHTEEVFAQVAKKTWGSVEKTPKSHADSEVKRSSQLRGTKGITYSSPINQVAAKLLKK